jgi:hypothetical protein
MLIWFFQIILGGKRKPYPTFPFKRERLVGDNNIILIILTIKKAKIYERMKNLETRMPIRSLPSQGRDLERVCLSIMIL